MNKVGRAIALATICVAASGCYHQVIQTGKAPGPKVIDKPWFNTFLWGLVVPQTLNVASDCRTGIATVVTEASLLNGLANLVTFGLYSPRHVTVTCAVGSASLNVRQHTDVGF